MHWEAAEGGKCRCRLCPHMCLLDLGEEGICQNKRNEKGRLMAVHYGRITALNLDPVEKKPLYHFLPGRNILSVGPFGGHLPAQNPAELMKI
jgi:pyruvate formate lyase activating enzyme